MQTRFIHIVNHLRALGKTFNNEDLINKVLGCLNQSWQPKVTAISESRDLTSMDLATLFGKLQEHEIQLNRLKESEEGEKKKKGLALAATTKNSEFEGGDSFDESDDDMALLFRQFKKFMQHRGKPKQFQNSQKKSDEGTSFNATCYKCGKKGVGLGPWSMLLSRSQVRFPLVPISVG
ncbi:receptor-like protein kinase [Trifolium pratense]|uniref:Receptor-like protein kinase n=1 Tax=Trifolium pratense TaxID=57577 RepID=A0A2K3LGH9_TRIPR|nr:receptor-like protein kinase [Trifolium pratense]